MLEAAVALVEMSRKDAGAVREGKH